VFAGLENIMIFSKTSNSGKYKIYHDIFDIFQKIKKIRINCITKIMDVTRWCSILLLLLRIKKVSN